MKIGDIVRVRSIEEIVANGGVDPRNQREFSGITHYYTGDQYGILTEVSVRSCGETAQLQLSGGSYFMLRNHLEVVMEDEEFSRFPMHNNIAPGQVLSFKTDDPIKKKVVEALLRSYVSNTTAAKIMDERSIVVARESWHADRIASRYGLYNITILLIDGNRRHEYMVPVASVMGIRENVEFERITTSTRCCTRCSNNYLSRYDFITNMELDIDEEDSGLCPECRKRKFVTPYHRLTPKLKFGNTDHDADPDLYLGFELEVARGGERNSVAAKVMDLMNENEPTVYCSHDSSINCGFEIISHPLTMEKHRDNKELYEKLFKMLVHEGYRSHDDSSCGLHVHFSRAYFDKYEGSIDRLIFIMNKFWDDIVLFSRKTQDAIERYARTLSGWDRDEFIERWDKSGDHDGHYYALNLVNEHTIEFRIWRGTLKLSTFMLTMEATYNMIQAAAHKTLAELDDMKFEDFLDDAGKRYYQIKKDALEFGLGENVEA